MTKNTCLHRQIDATDRQIDLSACGHAQAGRLVYELYGVTEKEVRITDVSRRGDV